MSAIFETEFRDLPMPEPDKNGKERHAKASSMKIVLLALADHANDDGEAWPGFTRLELKTGLSRQGVADVLSALRYNGLVFVRDEPSKRGTNYYTINVQCFPKLLDKEDQRLLVKPLDQPGQATLPEAVKPLDSNHPLTTIKPSLDDKQISKPTARIDRTEAEQEELDKKKNAWLFPTSQTEIDENIFAKEATDNFESCLHFNPLPWSSNRDWEKFEKFVIGEYRKDKTVWQRYDEWRKDKGKYVGAMSNKAIKYRPADFIACFPDFLAHTAMYGKASQPRDIETDSTGAPITW